MTYLVRLGQSGSAATLILGKLEHGGMTESERHALAPSGQLLSEVTDIELMRRIGQGDPQAYRRLADRELPKILRFAERVLQDRGEAEDVAQETFLRLWRHAKDWTPRAQVTTWLFRIARNLCLDRLRKAPSQASEDADLVPTSGHPAVMLERKREAEAVQKALGALPVRQRMALSLVHYEGLSQLEAADVLEIKVAALESLLARGRRTLRAELAHLLRGDAP